MNYYGGNSSLFHVFNDLFSKYYIDCFVYFDYVVFADGIELLLECVFCCDCMQCRCFRASVSFISTFKSK